VCGWKWTLHGPRAKAPDDEQRARSYDNSVHPYRSARPVQPLFGSLVTGFAPLGLHFDSLITHGLRRILDRSIVTLSNPPKCLTACAADGREILPAIGILGHRFVA
jgi:hypothetical protein